ncbi:MAG: 50S ribosomal protein L22 [Candidatus Magasanikbacteria bacterium]|nr:50S ribosomal protein L22 [Candidatus Magasanikbacteria bacterium]
MTLVDAQLRYYRQSPRKVRLVADLIRGKTVARAIAALTHLNKRAARPLLKLLNSAVANAQHNFKLDPDTLVVRAITVDGGPVLKRWTPRAHGRATPIRERTSHVKLVLAPRRRTAAPQS